jgi:hypothetical protein
MTIRARLARLEATDAARHPPNPWARCIHDPEVETLEDVIARDFGGVRPENLIVWTIISPEARP